MTYLKFLEAGLRVSPSLASQRIERFDSTIYSLKGSLSNPSPVSYGMRESWSLASFFTCQRSRHLLMPKAAGKNTIPDLLWVSFDSKYPVRIEIGKAKFVSQIIQLIKKELSPGTDHYCVDDLALIKADGSKADPRDSVDSLCVGDSYQSPLTVVVGLKNILIRGVDEELRQTNSYMERSVGCDSDLRDIWEGKGSGFLKVSDPLGKIFTRFVELEDGERYTVYSRYEASLMEEVRWQEIEKRAMKADVALALKKFLEHELGRRELILEHELGRESFDTTAKKVVQEWDAIYRV